MTDSDRRVEYLTKVIQTRYKDFIPVENLFQIGKNGGAGQEPDQRAGGRALRQADQVPTGRCAQSLLTFLTVFII